MFPVTLNIRGQRCLVVGGGAVAGRKVRPLVEAGGSVTVIAPEVVPDIEAAAARNELRWERRPYRPGEASEYFFVIAATDDRAVNEQVSRDAAGAGRLVNVVDAPELSNAFSPAVVRRGDLQVAVSTSGACPALSRKLREDIEEWFPPSYGLLLDRLGAFREKLRASVADPAVRKAILNRIVRSPELNELLDGGEAALDALLSSAVDAATRSGEPDAAMRLFVVGVDHECAPLDLRERLAFSDAECRTELEALRARPEVGEAVLLSTCNRTELYVRCVPGADPAGAAGALIRELIRSRGAAALIPDRFYCKTDGDAVRHLFRVAAGLESMIQGETEILGQVKRAYSAACEAGACGAFMHKLFHAAFRVGKRAQTETGIGAGTVSTSRAVIDLAEQRAGGLSGKALLVVGAGRIASRAAAYGRDAGIGSLLIVNRTESAARNLAERLGGQVRSFAGLAAALAEADVAVISTAARGCIIAADVVRDAAAQRSARSLLVIDTGVPRNVDPAVTDVPGVTLLDIDDLRGVLDRNRERRRSEVRKVEEILHEETAAFERWHFVQGAALAAQNLVVRVREVCREEIGRFAMHFSAEQLQHVEALTRSLAGRLLHHFIQRPKGREGDADER